MIGPKDERKGGQTTRYHARERMKADGSEWTFEELPLPRPNEYMILVRVMVAKIRKTDSLVQILRQIPIRQGQEGWNCVGWVKEALSRLEASRGILGTNMMQWQVVRDGAMSYVQQKKDQHRFDGKGNFDNSLVPTFDLLLQKEITI